MAMNGNGMGSEVWSAIAAYLQDADGNHRNPSLLEGEALWQLICTKVVQHIQANAKCSGIDSHGDTHDAVGVT